MRVLIISNMYPTPEAPNGGIFVTRRAEALREAGLDVELCGIGVGSENARENGWRFTGRLSSAARTLNRLNPSRIGIARMAAAVLERVAHRPDIVVGHGMYLPPAGAVAVHVANELRVPSVITAHGSDINQVMRRYRRSHSRTLSRASAVVYVSGALRGAAERAGGGRSNTFVVPNGVDHSVFFPSSVGPRPMEVAFVGAQVPVKGADHLPDLFSEVREQAAAASFVVVGDGPLRSAIEDACRLRELPVRFTGTLQAADVAEVMRNARVLVLPSRSEGWPCTILEAHASGTFVVGADVGGVCEAIGDRAAVVPRDSPRFIQRLAERVVYGLNHQPEESHRLVARSTGFAWSAIAEQERVLYTDLVDRRKPSGG